MDGLAAKGMVLRELSDEDRIRARAKALAARTRRAEIKNQFGAGKLSITELLDLVPNDEAIGRLRVMDLLESVPGVGEIRAHTLIDRLGISPRAHQKSVQPRGESCHDQNCREVLR